jgi:hypothetical protein
MFTTSIQKAQYTQEVVQHQHTGNCTTSAQTEWKLKNIYILIIEINRLMSRLVWAADRFVIFITGKQVKYVLMTIYYS